MNNSNLDKYILMSKKINIKRKKLLIFNFLTPIIFLTLFIVFGNQILNIGETFYYICLYIIVFLFVASFICLFLIIHYRKSLLSTYRNIMALEKYDKRAICNISDVYDCIKFAEYEKFKVYAIMFAYENNLYVIGTDVKETGRFYFLYSKDNEEFENNSLEELIKSKSFEHEVTVLREFQNSTIKSAPIVLPVEYSVTNFIKSSEVLDNIVETTIRDNFILKPYIITNKNEKFNYNTNDEINNLFK